jgi:hypothetical protein
VWWAYLVFPSSRYHCSLLLAHYEFLSARILLISSSHELTYGTGSDSAISLSHRADYDTFVAAVGLLLCVCDVWEVNFGARVSVLYGDDYREKVKQKIGVKSETSYRIVFFSFFIDLRVYMYIYFTILRSWLDSLIWSCKHHYSSYFKNPLSFRRKSVTFSPSFYLLFLAKPQRRFTPSDYLSSHLLKANIYANMSSQHMLTCHLNIC